MLSRLTFTVIQQRATDNSSSDDISAFHESLLLSWWRTALHISSLALLAFGGVAGSLVAVSAREGARLRKSARQAMSVAAIWLCWR